MNKLTLGLSFAALAACGAAFAAQIDTPAKGWGNPGPVTRAEAQTRANAMFDRLDANKDGKLDATDREARRTARRTAMFDQLDANKDGQVSRDEFTNFRMERGMGRRGEGMGGPGMGGHGKGHHRMGHHGMGHHGMGGMMQGMADTNKDGAVSKDEFMAAHTAHFDRMDADHDGTVTVEERQAARQAMRQSMRKRMGAPAEAASPAPAD
ncbi:MAG: EF-hand domain-containing protein [Novosphingobium sp.]